MELISEYLINELGLTGGISVAINLFILVQWLRGEFVPRRRIDEAHKMADTFEHGMSAAMANQERTTAVLAKMDVMSDTFAHFLEALPRVEGDK